MMKRIAEPDLMDDKAQAEAYASTDFSEPHDAFVEHFKKRFPEFSKGEVLDLGCGTADVIIRFAKAFPETGILGIDGARSMLDIGLQDIKKHALDKQITLKQCMLPDRDLSNQGFDALIRPLVLHVCQSLIVVSNCNPGSAEAQADSPISFHKSRAFTVSDTTPSFRRTRFQSPSDKTFSRKSLVTRMELLEFCPETVM